ncbi:hypothetical protein M0Q97_13315 [Candidatus Dojkabacteria bacterium]|jgi:hypothetical protein|nr:hypothetical protein [Candidatus Dojkabacteria bacterium]
MTKKFYEQNREKVLAYQSAQKKKKYKENKEYRDKMNAYSKKYYADNPKKIKAYRENHKKVKIKIKIIKPQKIKKIKTKILTPKIVKKHLKHIKSSSGSLSNILNFGEK